MKKLLAVNYIFIFFLSLLFLIISVAFVFTTLSDKIPSLVINKRPPYTASINAVVVNGDTYDAVICPTGSTDNTCTHFGAKEMQQVINNAPQRPKENPYKVFVKNGEYRGFEPVIYQDLSLFEVRAVFLIKGGISILGESQGVVFDGENIYADFFRLEGSANLQVTNLLFKRLSKNIRDTIPNSCPVICNGTTGRAFSVSENSNLYLLNVVLTDFYSGVVASEFSQVNITRSSFYNMAKYTYLGFGNSTGTIKASRFFNYNSLELQQASVLTVYNSILYNAGSLHINLFYDSEFKLANSVAYFSNNPEFNYGCLHTGSNKRVFVVNSILSRCDGHAVRSSASHSPDSGVRISYSFINNWSSAYTAFSGDVQVTADPRNSGTFVDPGLILNENNIEDPLNFTFALNNSKVRNAGDPTISDPDGSRSDIGLFGGPYACLVKSDLPGCAVAIPTPTPLPSFTPITSPSIITPTNFPNGEDINKDGAFNISDIFAMMKILFK